MRVRRRERAREERREDARSRRLTRELIRLDFDTEAWLQKEVRRLERRFRQSINAGRVM